MGSFFSGYGDFAAPCAASPLPVCYVTNTTYSGCLSNPTMPAPLHNVGVGALIVTCLVFVETVLAAYYLSTQQSWIGRRERSLMFMLIAAATGFQAVVYGGAGYGTRAITILASFFIGSMNAAYTSMVAASLIGLDWIPEGGHMSMVLSIVPSGILFIVTSMMLVVDSLQWNGPPGTPTKNPDAFFLFFIWPLICMALFVFFQTWALAKLRPSWKTISCLYVAVGLYAISFVLVFPFSSAICVGTGQALNGVFFGVILQGLAYGVLLQYFRFASTEGWEVSTVAFDDFALGNQTLSADTRTRMAAAGAPIPLPKDGPTINQGAGTNISGRSARDENYYYGEPYI